MIIDATFWVAISFFIFCAVLIYLKVPQKINSSLISQINAIKKELDEAKKLKVEAKNLLSNYESKIEKAKKETKDIINLAKKDSEKIILEKTKKFHEIMEARKTFRAFSKLHSRKNEVVTLIYPKPSKIAPVR